ncbi:hypothetical protein P7C71_g3251, partial [Lecanoromycetidae sp. Uapishka_2]
MGLCIPMTIGKYQTAEHYKIGVYNREQQRLAAEETQRQADLHERELESQREAAVLEQEEELRRQAARLEQDQEAQRQAEDQERQAQLQKLEEAQEAERRRVEQEREAQRQADEESRLQKLKEAQEADFGGWSRSGKLNGRQTRSLNGRQTRRLNGRQRRSLSVRGWRKKSSTETKTLRTAIISSAFTPVNLQTQPNPGNAPSSVVPQNVNQSILPYQDDEDEAEVVVQERNKKKNMIRVMKSVFEGMVYDCRNALRVTGEEDEEPLTTTIGQICAQPEDLLSMEPDSAFKNTNQGKADLEAFHLLYTRPVKALMAQLEAEIRGIYDGVAEGNFYASQENTNESWLEQAKSQWHATSTRWASAHQANTWIQNHLNVFHEAVLYLGTNTSSHALMEGGYRGHHAQNMSWATCLYKVSEDIDKLVWQTRMTVDVRAGSFLGIVPGLLYYDPFPLPDNERPTQEIQGPAED